MRKNSVKTTTTVLAALALLAAGASAHAQIDTWPWQHLGEWQGVTVGYARIPNSDSVRVKLNNRTGNSVRVSVRELVLWCGSQRSGAGDRKQIRMQTVTLRPHTRESWPGWYARCSRDLPFYIEYAGLTVERI